MRSLINCSTIEEITQNPYHEDKRRAENSKINLRCLPIKVPGKIEFKISNKSVNVDFSSFCEKDSATLTFADQETETRQI